MNDLPDSTSSSAFLPGSRRLTLAALRERVEQQLEAETAGRPDLLSQVEEADRREMIREVVDYTLTVESVHLERIERLRIQQMIYDELFNFSVLAPYVADPAVTEIALKGDDQIAVRYGAQDIAPVAARFDDPGHLDRVLNRTLANAGAALSEDAPVIEVGTRFGQRPARLTVFAPPVSPLLNVQIRLQPAQPATLDHSVEAGLLTEAARQWLHRIMAAGHGLMVVGDVGTGKTTLLQALLTALPSGTAVVERAAELRVPPDMQPFTATQAVSFADQIEAALQLNPPVLVLDEVRFDESSPMWRALSGTAPLRCLWALRGSVEPLRLRNAFSLSVRRAVPTVEQSAIHEALMTRLPFVALMARRAQQLRLTRLCEWQPDEAADSLALRSIWSADDVPTVAPRHSLDTRY